MVTDTVEFVVSIFTCQVKVYTVDMLNRQSIAQAADTVKREVR